MSKELFFNMRAEDMAIMYSENFSKKDAELTGQELVKTIINEGNVDPKKVFSNIVRLKAVIDSADKTFRDELKFISNDSFNGVEFTPNNPRESLNYEEDLVWVDLKNKLKQRELLITQATKSKTNTIDEKENPVYGVSSKFTKSSITVKF
jgi:hypothetical protein